MKYKAPNCSYPFIPGDPLDYCWAYAQYVDKGEQASEEMKKKCRGCKYWEKRRKDPEGFIKRMSRIIREAWTEEKVSNGDRI